MSILVETATVYRGGGRRWLTRQAAERAEAKRIINKRCECYRGSGRADDPDETCAYHNMETERYMRLVHLMVVMFVRPESRVANRPICEAVG